VPGYPKVECPRVPCADPYMGFDQPGTPVDKSKPRQDPFGTGNVVEICCTLHLMHHLSIGDSYVEYGECPIDKPYPDEDVVCYIALCGLFA
jgi:hypothetical protein